MSEPTFAPQMPPGTISLPEKGEQHIVIAIRDWTRLRANVESLASQQRQYAAVAWSAVGIAAGALLAVLAWYPAYGALPDDDRLDYAWIGPTMIAFVIGGVAGAGLMFWAAHNEKKRVEATVEAVVADMDEMPPTPIAGKA